MSSRNNERLLGCLQDLIARLSLPPRHEELLRLKEITPDK